MLIRLNKNLGSFIGIIAIIAMVFLGSSPARAATTTTCDANNYICLTAPSGVKVGETVEIKVTVTEDFAEWLAGPYNQSVYNVTLKVFVLTDAQTATDMSSEAQLNSVLKGSWSFDRYHAEAKTYTASWNTGGTTADTGGSNHHIWLKAFETSASDETHPEITSAKTTVTVTTTSTGTTDDDGDSGSGSASSYSPGSIDLKFNTIKNLPDLFDTIIKVARYLIFAASLGTLVWGASLMMEASTDPNKVATAKKIILYSIVGLLLAIFSQTIINAAIDRFYRLGSVV